MGGWWVWWYYIYIQIFSIYGRNDLLTVRVFIYTSLGLKVKV